MRSALLCVFYAIIVYKEVSLATDEDFKPTPIPLNDWNSSARGAGSAEVETAGTLQEIIATDATPLVAAVPAHYWEDALRHSVYLTLVRDKIDQLIAKGSTDSRRDQKDDDHDLWDKIKTAPFDRLNSEEPAILGDITIMSKGRLLEETNGLRFTEDEMSKEKCNEEQCNEGVKAYWSVKRVRQREAETAPGKYHYELTFSVSSQTPKKQKKPYENPVRTFTVREGTPVEKPQYRFREPAYAPRPQRAVWFHKNIVPTPPRQSKHEHGLDRLFNSWFSDDEPPKRYKHVSYVPQMHPQHSKIGHVGAPTEQYHQKHGPPPYPYKPQSQNIPTSSFKYPRPPLAPPLGPPGSPPLGPPPVANPHIKQHYIDLDAIRNSNQFTPPPPPEIKYLSPNLSNAVKTTKPLVMPTPPISYAPLNATMDLKQTSNLTEMTTTKDPDIITGFTTYSMPKPPPTKHSYFPEHVRPPVFNAPPGIFVTMDKKPFKPMPPLKYVHSHKHNKNRPVDFRPSPQVLDVQFSDPDPLSDSFRPIAMAYGNNSTNSSEQADGERRKPNRKSKPPKKKHDIKSHRHTTSVPDIITANGDVLDEMHWASIFESYMKTTPMVSHRLNMSETTTPLPSTTVSSTTTVHPTPSTTEALISVSQKPRRTRPPPTSPKPEKVKKHKRITTTTSTSTTTTTTEKPHHRRPAQDLTPQATSASTSPTKPEWQAKTKIQNITISTTATSANITNASTTDTTSEPPTLSTNVNPTTYRAVTTTRHKTTVTTTVAPTTTTEKPTTVSTTALKNNRFRQSTLMIKGTSVKHDKWSSPLLMEKNKTTVEKAKTVLPVSSKFPRRKGSNFQGYVSSTPKVVDERTRAYHEDQVFNHKLNVISLGNTEATTDVVTSPMTTPPMIEESEEESEFEDLSGTGVPEEDDDTDETDHTNEGDIQESRDQGEYIFDSSEPQTSDPEDNLNEVEPESTLTTEETITTSIHSVAKNKTKCKKKKNDQMPKTGRESENEISVAPLETTTEKLSTADFFNEIFGFTVDQNETNANQTDSKYVDNDEDLEEFLHSINEKKDSIETNDDEEYEEDDKEEAENSPFNNDEENRFPRNAESSYEDYQDRPYSFLELMAME